MSLTHQPDMGLLQTEHISINPGKCHGCFKCVSACPNQVLAPLRRGFHKHVIIADASKCIGCLKCKKVCRHQAIT